MSKITFIGAAVLSSDANVKLQIANCRWQIVTLLPDS